MTPASCRLFFVGGRDFNFHLSLFDKMDLENLNINELKRLRTEIDRLIFLDKSMKFRGAKMEYELLKRPAVKVEEDLTELDPEEFPNLVELGRKQKEWKDR